MAEPATAAMAQPAPTTNEPLPAAREPLPAGEPSTCSSRDAAHEATGGGDGAHVARRAPGHRSRSLRFATGRAPSPATVRTESGPSQRRPSQLRPFQQRQSGRGVPTNQHASIPSRQRPPSPVAVHPTVGAAIGAAAHAIAVRLRVLRAGGRVRATGTGGREQGRLTRWRTLCHAVHPCERPQCE